jgi:phosphatidylserine/phosphatidylglycerophosphate/cardiolipin synthase-like enzyme
MAELAEVLFSPKDDVAGRLRSLIASAESNIDAAVFTITDDRISRALLSAHRRGVQVRILTDDDKAFDIGSDIDELRHAGIAVRIDAGQDHMHHKFALFDRAVVVTGSYNWTRSASAYNHENILITSDPRLVGPYLREFDLLWRTLVDTSRPRAG